MKTHRETTPITLRPATEADAPRLQEIRRRSFAPVFASFRALLGDDVDRIVHARADEEQAALLASLLLPDSGWTVHVARIGDAASEGDIVGFVAVQLNRHSGIGEIGLNAVDPVHAGRGVGTAMYAFALGEMRAAGMRAAVVGTGGDDSHAPARRAYEKVGFVAGVPSVWLAQAL